MIHPTNLGWGGLHERLFLNKYGSKQRFYENEYQGYDYQEVRARWLKTRQWFQQSATAHFPSELSLSPHFLQFDYADAKSWEWIHQHEHNVAQLWHIKQGVYRRQVLADVRDEPHHKKNSPTLATSSRLGRPAARNPEVIQIQSDLLIFSFPACCHGGSKVVHPIQVCERELGPHQSGLLYDICAAGTAPLIDCIARFSVCDPPRPWR